MTHIKTGDDFDCPVADCNRQFSQHSALRSHLEDQHVISQTQQASCKRCSLLFANSRRLLLHYQTKHDDAEGSHKRPMKEESPVAADFSTLSNMDLNTAMQLLAGGQPLNGKPPMKKRRTNGNKRNSATPTFLSNSMDSPQSAFAATMASLRDMPLDMARRSSPPTALTPPSLSNGVIQFSKAPESSRDDVVVDVCSTESEIKKEASTSASPKLPKAESPDYEKIIADNYQKFAALRPEFAPFINSSFNPFFIVSFQLLPRVNYIYPF